MKECICTRNAHIYISSRNIAELHVRHGIAGDCVPMATHVRDALQTGNQFFSHSSFHMKRKNIKYILFEMSAELLAKPPNLIRGSKSINTHALSEKREKKKVMKKIIVKKFVKRKTNVSLWPCDRRRIFSSKIHYSRPLR